MADDNVIYHEEVVAEYPIEYEEWDGTVAHEVTVEDGDEYIQVEELDDGQQRYIEIPHGLVQYTECEQVSGAIYDQHHLQHMQSEPESELLHTRPDGSPLFTIPLQDLMSKQIDVPTQPPRSHTIVCFSKMCQTQLVFDGYLYTLTTQLNQMAYNIWRCVNENCTGAVRTSPNFASVKLRADHDQSCEPDENQLRIRVAVYDLNLLCEFMDCEMGQLYDNYVRKLRTEQPDLGSAFLDFELLQPMMEHHRLEMPFRKRFEARKAIQQRRREGLIIEKSKFKRTKPFPPSICTECNMEFPSGDLAPSQDLLIQHLTYQHERPLVIERYTFPEPNLFEAWIRELSQHSRYRLRKVGLYDEHMYYLCCSDDRQQRCNHGRGSIIHTQCSAFIRVHDWRYILRREIKQVIVDYCLDHCFHSGDSPMPDTYRQPIYDYYSPEVFMKEMEAKKARTQKMLQSAPSSIRSVRRLLNQPNTVFHPNVNAPEEVYIMDQGYQELEGQEWVPEEQFQQQQIDQQGAADRQQVPVPQLPQNRVTFNLMKKEVPLLREDQRNASNHVTVRQNFDDRATFESVLQLELQCDNLKQRMQQCRRPEVARRYLQRLTGILEDVLADPHCSPKSNGAAQEEMVLEEAPGPSRATPRFTTVRSAPRQQQQTQNPPIREAMFLQRSENGQMVVVKRPIKKAARRTVQVMAGQESVVQPLQPGQDRQVQPVRRMVQPVQQKIMVRQEPRNEMPANFLEPERKSNRVRRAPQRPGAE